MQHSPPAGGEGRLHAVLTAGMLRQHNQQTAADYRSDVERKDDEWTWETKSSSKYSLYSNESLASVGTAVFEATLLAHAHGIADIGAYGKKRSKRSMVKRKARKAKSKVAKRMSRAQAKSNTRLKIREAKNTQAMWAKDYAQKVRAWNEEVDNFQFEVQQDVQTQRDYATLVLAWIDGMESNNSSQRAMYKSEWKRRVGKGYSIDKNGKNMHELMGEWALKIPGTSSEETAFLKAWKNLTDVVGTLHQYNNDTYLPDDPKLSYTKAPGAEGWEDASRMEAQAATNSAKSAYDTIMKLKNNLTSDEEWETINAALASQWLKARKPKGGVERLLGRVL